MKPQNTVRKAFAVSPTPEPVFGLDLYHFEGDELEKKRAEARERTRKSRALWTEEQRDETRRKDRERKAQKRLAQTETEREEEQRKNRESHQRIREELTELERGEIRQQDRERKAVPAPQNDQEAPREPTFPPNTPEPLKRASLQFHRTIMEPWVHCTCCGEYRRRDKFQKPKSRAEAIVHHRMDPDVGEILLCRTCHTFKPSAQRPWCPFSQANNFGNGPIPEELKVLTFMEKEVIRRVHPFQALLVRPKGQQGARGQLIHLPASPADKLRQLLPADPHDVLLVAQEKPNGKVGAYHKLRVDKVLSALNFLKEHNHLYANVNIREEGEIRDLFERWEREINDASVTTTNDGTDTLMTNAEQDPVEPELPPTQSVVLDMEGDAERRVLAANTNQPVDRRSEFVEALAYPDLFPSGRGDFTDHTRPITLTEREYIQHRLRAHPEFQADEGWSFRALNNLNQLDMVKRIQFVQKTVATNRAPGALTSSELIGAMEEPGDEFEKENVLGKHYYQIGNSIRGTSMYWKKAQRHLFSMFATLGAPDLFLTLSANDLNWLDLFQAIDPVRFRTQRDVEALTITEKTELLNVAPAIAAEHFVNRVRALIAFLSSSATPLDYKLKNFFGRFEIQGRGSPHLHAVLWLEGAPKATDPNGPLYVDWIDSIISAQLPEKDVDPELYTMVSKFQVHHHTETCGGHKGDITEPQRDVPPTQVQLLVAAAAAANTATATVETTAPGARQAAETRRFFAIQQGRSQCRFGFPHPAATATHFRAGIETRNTVKGDKGIILCRHAGRDQWVNNYSPHILRIWQANMDLQPITEPYAAAAYILSYVTKNEQSERGYVKEALKGLREDATFPEVLRKLGNAILSYREVSKQETMLLVLGIPLYMSSLSTTFVPCFPPAQRQKISRPYSVLAQQEPDSTDVWQQGVIEAYCNRPHGEAWDSMTLLEFATWFEVTSVAADAKISGNSVAGSGELPEEYEELELEPDVTEPEAPPITAFERFFPERAASATAAAAAAYEPNPLWGSSITQAPFSRKQGEKVRKMPRFLLSGGSGKLARMRRTPRCVTSPMSNNHGLVTKYSLLAMNVPFRQELPELLGITDPNEVTEDIVEAAIIARREEIQARRSRMAAKFADRVQEIVDAVDQQHQQPQQHQHSDAADDSFNERELLQAGDSERQGASPLAFVTDDISQIPILTQLLAQEQLTVVHKVEAYLQQLDQYDEEMRAWKNAKETAEVFGGEIPAEPARPTPPRLIVLGPGGTGKSFLIRVVVLIVRRWSQLRCLTKPSPQQGVILAAPTGVAAFNVGGSTLHSAFALKVEKKGKAINQKLNARQLSTLKDKLRNCQLVIIDEVSMVGSRILADVHHRLNQVMNTPGGYFGNLGVILLGDFYQLPPVHANYVFDVKSPHLKTPAGVHLYRDLFKPVFLTVPQRQKGDLPFAQVLLNARLGTLTAEDDVILQSRSLSFLNENRSQLEARLTTDFDNAPRLFWQNRKADEYNTQRITKLAVDTGLPVIRMEAADRGSTTVPLTEEPDLTGGLMGQLDVIVGMPILLRSNINVADGLYNGARGRIAEITPPESDVTTSSSSSSSPHAPSSVFVHFEDPKVGARAIRKEIGGRPAVQIDPITVGYEYQGHQLRRTQLPMIPAFAFTIHKSQGLTLEKAVVDLEGSLPPGMAYTALSRVRNLDDLVITHYDRFKFKPNLNVLAEVQRLSETRM